jgi:hypothetical protein
VLVTGGWRAQGAEADVRDRRRADELGAPVALGDAVEVVEESLAAAQEDGDDRHVHLVDQAARRYCCTVDAPPPTLTSAPSAASKARPSAASMPSSTKWNVVPPSMVIGGRG